MKHHVLQRNQNVLYCKRRQGILEQNKRRILPLTIKDFENGFSLISELFNAREYTDHKFTDSYSKNIEYNSIECIGRLKITDTLKLKNALFYRIEDLREFGTEMILIKKRSIN